MAVQNASVCVCPANNKERLADYSCLSILLLADEEIDRIIMMSALLCDIDLRLLKSQEESQQVDRMQDILSSVRSS
jgi:hypothetical protein